MSRRWEKHLVLLCSENDQLNLGRGSASGAVMDRPINQIHGKSLLVWGCKPSLSEFSALRFACEVGQIDNTGDGQPGTFEADRGQQALCLGQRQATYLDCFAWLRVERYFARSFSSSSFTSSGGMMPE
jgi:hypothetical protein